MIDYTNLQKSLANLKAQHENWQTLEAGLPQLMREAVAESVIQRFEVCYNCLWKVLKRYLSEALGIPDVPSSPKPILRIAHENRLFDDIDTWLSYADQRVDTTHDYSGEKAQRALAMMARFIQDASALCDAMRGERI
jgi:nucleotidyltransferase substrate binding protein (TIGR01987 family)